MKGCTFRPVTNNPVNPETKRPLEEFLTFQTNHLKKVQDNVKSLKDERESKQIESLTAPAIDKKSAKIFEQKIRTDDPTFLRLYKRQFELKKKPEPEKTGKKRTVETDERIQKLYNDEFTKQKKMKDLSEKADQFEKPETDSLYSSNKLVLQRFENQYNNEITNLEKNNGENSAQITKLNLMQFCK